MKREYLDPEFEIIDVALDIITTSEEGGIEGPDIDVGEGG